MPEEINPEAPKSIAIWDKREAGVLKFLYSHRDMAFRPWEIAEHTEVARNDVYNATQRLHSRDLIGITPNGYYFALNDQQVISYLTDRYGPDLVSYS